MLYLAICVKPVSRFTALYMALIDPFRRLAVYPALGRHAQQRWSRTYAQVPQGPAPTASSSGDLADRRMNGLLNEYNGRSFVEGSDRLERFYCNEAETARLFRRSVGVLAQEQRLSSNVNEKTEQECLVSFYSKAIADRLNSCYRFTVTDQRREQGPDGTYRRTAAASLERGLFFRASAISALTERGLSDDVFFRRRAVAYLAGAWARFGHDQKFVFSNARAKADLIAVLLLDLGCRNIIVESTVGLTPQGNAVHFEPTPEVTEWLQKTW
jgi:hypothetical protein